MSLATSPLSSIPHWSPLSQSEIPNSNNRIAKIILFLFLAIIGCALLADSSNRSARGEELGGKVCILTAGIGFTYQFIQYTNEESALISLDEAYGD